MGCDGGTIPRRDELVKTKKKPEQKDKASELSFRWQHCALTQQPLQTPIVACEMGRLYSKESIIEAILDKSEDNQLKDLAPHIKSLKDLKVLSLTDNPAWIESARGENGDSYIDTQKAKWICPMSGLEMNGRFRFCLLWSCGCVISEKALKEMIKLKEEGNECPKCQKVFKVLDIISLNPTEEKDFVTLQEKMSLRRILAKEAKDAKKAGKKRSAGAVETATSSNSSVKNGESKEKAEPSSSKLVNANRESSSSSKKSKIIQPPIPVAGAAKSGPTLQKDPRTSEVYKSLFTSHPEAQNRNTAHWVTYNPFYN